MVLWDEKLSCQIFICFQPSLLPQDNYMAIEIKESKPVLRFNLGGEDGEVTVNEDVSDGQWHKIVAER